MSTKLLAAAAASLVVFHCYSQKVQLINTGEVLERGKLSYDSGNYSRAIQQFLTIEERDTNYVASQAELAITYLAQEEYDKVIETCEKALLKPSEHRGHLLRSMAIALDKKGEYPKSVALFQKTIGEYPADPVLIYNYGITLINGKEYTKAKEQFFQALSINPFHAGSHRALGRVAILEGRKVHAMLAMGVYLSINPSDNANLVSINNFVLNTEKDEGTVTPTGENAFEKLDQIVRAKMAMDKNFKSKFDFDFAIVRQFEMFFEQIDMAGAVDDQYKNYYLPFYKLVKNGHLEAFTYNLVKSTPSDQVKKWTKKNEKTLKAFYDEAGSELRKRRNRPVMPATLGLPPDYAGWYYDNGRLGSVGAKDASGKMTGKWCFFHSNFERSAEGTFGPDEEKTGVWKYYSASGRLSKTENFSDGEVNVYHDNGNLYQHFFLVKNMIEGSAEVMYSCGTVKEKYNYKQDKRDGPGKTFHPDGKLQSEFSYKEGELEGEYKTYYENGVLLSKLSYKAGKAQGPYWKYHPNGRVEAIGAFENDERSGEWSYFYSNGAPDRKGSYKSGLGIGEWLFYNERGELIEKRNLDQNGDFQGDDTYYEAGKVHYIITYKKNVPLKYIYLNEQGKEVAKYESNDGTMPVKFHYFTGQVSGEGKLKKGENHGPWKYYHRYGVLKSQYNYNEGRLEGEGVEYYPGGAKQSVANYKDGELHGYYQSFYHDGKVKEEGWYQDGMKQQRWLSYFPDGKVESDEYYLNDVLRIHSVDYSPEGALVTRRDFDDEGGIAGLIFIDRQGKPSTKVKGSAPKKVYETYFSNGKVQSKIETDCGAYYGAVLRAFPDGKTFYQYNLLNNKRYGKFQYFDPAGQLETEGSYVDGWAEGVWKRYSRGKLEGEGRNFNNKYDSTWTFYSADGKVSSVNNYLRGERHGLVTVMNEEGKPVVEKKYDYGDLVSYRVIRKDGNWSDWIPFTGAASIEGFYPNGVKAFEETLAKGLVTGVKKTYFPDGKLSTEHTFQDGDYNGPFTEYFANGKVRQRGTYVMDDLNGKLELFNEDGSPLRTEQYHYGSRSGKTILYAKGGKSKEYHFIGSNVYE